MDPSHGDGKSSSCHGDGKSTSFPPQTESMDNNLSFMELLNRVAIEAENNTSRYIPNFSTDELVLTNSVLPDIMEEPIEGEMTKLLSSKLNPWTITSLSWSCLIGLLMRLETRTQVAPSGDDYSVAPSLIALPEEVQQNASSWYDYTVCSHRGGGIVLVHYYKGILHSCVLSFVNDAVNWTVELMVDLVVGFGSRISDLAWQRMLGREAFPIGSDHFFSLQVRKASKDGRFVLFTLGFDLGMFEVDMINSTVRYYKCCPKWDAWQSNLEKKVGCLEECTRYPSHGQPLHESHMLGICLLPINSFPRNLHFQYCNANNIV